MKKGEMGGAYIRSGKPRKTLKHLAWKPEFGRLSINLEVDGRLLLKCILKK
jgi:hypothetical protein